MYGSDAGNDPAQCIDAEGKPIIMKKRKHKMCENIYQKRYYKDEGIEMKETKNSILKVMNINKIFLLISDRCLQNLEF